MVKYSIVFKIVLILLLVLNFQKAFSSDGVKMANADSLITYAQKFIGVPYKWSGKSPQGFDCSGFVSYIFEHYDIVLPRSSVDYQFIGRAVPPDSSRKGDIILFCGRDNNLARVGHVGIVISNPGEPLKFIHSSSSKKHWGVTISEFTGTGYINRFVGIRRLNSVLMPETNIIPEL